MQSQMKSKPAEIYGFLCKTDEKNTQYSVEHRASYEKPMRVEGSVRGHTCQNVHTHTYERYQAAKWPLVILKGDLLSCARNN